MYTLAVLGIRVFIFNIQKIKTTTLLASQAHITTAAISGILKFSTGRQRPIYFDSQKLEAAPTFMALFSQWEKMQTIKI